MGDSGDNQAVSGLTLTFDDAATNSLPDSFSDGPIVEWFL